LDIESLTTQIDEVIDMIGTDESGRLASAAARRILEHAVEADW
jgi:hypothetical protein